MTQKAGPHHVQDTSEVAQENVGDTELIVPVRLLQKREISQVSVLPFPLLDLSLHMCKISRELETLAIAKPDVVIWVTFDQFDSFSLEAGTEIAKGMVK